MATELYQRAEDIDWELLTDRERSAYYGQWVEDAKIGGVLSSCLPHGDIRVWIKDGPMKEYVRALEGIGTYARCATKRFPPHETLIKLGLGPSWNLVPKSVAEKPMHCMADFGPRRRYVCWGAPHTFKDLVWAALGEAVKSTEAPLIIVTTRTGHPQSFEAESFQKAVAERCGLQIAHVSRKLTPIRVV
ncbi:hypothetical protein QX204_06815 [Nocardia sp. PE-7]|uniref:hypothetical protein n=1 Tax=Nocardia sp. PE-7 TaxID=3058426 RepID=UPI002658EBFD|nr:hypothetical protein [Nocardia sp. PE-7]WKG11173.1 hypothetical protein QX204_06815 [Nocardia sp. PE-7]